MKLVRKGTPATIGGTTARPSTYQIESSPLAFKILSSGLYNDKILACLRELCCNAQDSHIAAGKATVPFELHLPTLLEPHCTVKDYGTGMSHAAVRRLYSKYFSSNRFESNDYTGAMGLGSKSPFCYTEGFTVVSRFVRKNKFREKAICATYSMFMEPVAQGVVPRWVLLHHRPMEADEQIGLEVSFPCKEQDIQEFENRARIALEFFDPRPKINLKNFVIPKTEYILKGNGWALRKDASTHQTYKVRAIQGMVQYNAGAIDQSRMNPEQKIVADMPLDLFFNIGEISVTASRESLSNEEDTIDTVLKRLFEVHESTLEAAKKEIASCNTEWDARLYLWNLEQATSGPIIKAAFARGDFSGVYGSTGNIKFALKKKPRLCELDFHVLNLQTFYRNYGKWATKSKVFSKKDRASRIDLIQKAGVVRSDHTKEFDVDPKTQFFIADMKRGGEKYLHRYVQNREDCPGTCYLFTKIDKTVTDAEFKKEVTRALDTLGNPPLRTLSELSLNTKYADPKADPKDPSTYERRNIVYLDASSSSAWTRVWRKATDAMIQKPGKKYYVNLERLRPIYFDAGGAKRNQFGGVCSMESVVNNAFGAGILKDSASKHIFGLKAKALKLKKDPDWIELVPFIQPALVKLLNPTIERSMSLIKNSFSFRLEKVCKHATEKGLLPTSNPIMEFFRDWKVLNRAAKNKRLEAISWLCDWAKIKLKHQVNFEKRYDKMIKKYPMISIGYSHYDDTEAFEAVIPYIKLMDSINAIPMTVITEQEIANVATV